MITTVCLNPCFDKTVEVDHMELYAVNRIRKTRMDPGGKGINVAVVAQRLGLNVQCIGIMGENGSDILSSMLNQEKLIHHFTKIPGSIRTNLKVYSGDGNGVTELNESGALVSEENLKAFFDLAKQETGNSELVVLTGSVPPGSPEGLYRDLMLHLDGKKCILDAEGQELITGCEAHPFLIKPNIQELGAAVGQELKTLRSIREAAMSFIERGAENAVVSMGNMGAMFVNAVQTLYAPALHVPVKSTVGAGDSMVGGILAGYLKYHDLRKAFCYGVAAGSASVMTEGTQLLNREDFEQLLNRVQIQEV